MGEQAETNSVLTPLAMQPCYKQLSPPVPQGSLLNVVPTEAKPGYLFDMARGVKIREKSKPASTLKQTTTRHNLRITTFTLFPNHQTPFDVIQKIFIGYDNAEGMARHKSHRDRDQHPNQL